MPEHEFSKSVNKAKGKFEVGNLFEVVLSQTFRNKLDAHTKSSVLFRRLRARNPSPYGFFVNLGEDKYLVGASPEMFFRCEPVLQNDCQAYTLCFHFTRRCEMCHEYTKWDKKSTYSDDLEKKR